MDLASQTSINTVTCTNSVQEYAGDVYLTVLSTTPVQRLPIMMKSEILANSTNSCADSVHQERIQLVRKIKLDKFFFQKIQVFFRTEFFSRVKVYCFSIAQKSNQQIFFDVR